MVNLLGLIHSKFRFQKQAVSFRWNRGLILRLVGRHPVKATVSNAFHERRPRPYVLPAKVAEARLGYVAIQT